MAEYSVLTLPLIEGDKKLAQVTEEVCAPMERRAGPLWWVAFLVSAAHFRLRVNNKKQTLYSQTPGMVAASLKYPDWHERRGLEGSAGAGNAGVILGTPSSRFPGDSRDRRRLPAPPRAPEEENRSGIERAPETKAEDAVVGAALPEGPQRGPVAGCLYFPYDGKLKSLKTLELLYEGPRGTASLRLM